MLTYSFARMCRQTGDRAHPLMTFSFLRLASKFVEIAFAAALMLVFLAVLVPNLVGGPNLNEERLAVLVWTLVAATPTFAVAFGSLRGWLWPRLVGWATLLFLVVAVLHK